MHTSSTKANPFTISSPTFDIDAAHENNCVEYSLVNADGSDTEFSHATVSYDAADKNLKIEVKVDATNIEELLDLVGIGAQEFRIKARSSQSNQDDKLSGTIKIAFRCAPD